MEKSWHLEIKDDVAFLTFDFPGEKINKFTWSVMDELEDIIDNLPQAKALVIQSAKKDIFIAGADLKQFEDLLKDPKKVREVLEKGHRVFNKLEDLPFPSIAVIDGACLGGGMELALGCQYRIVTDNPHTSLGLPEVSLGLMPGWGATQRMPRLVGLQQGLKMILGSKPVDGKKAFKMGLADIILPQEFLAQQLPAAIQKCIDGKARKKKKKGVMNWLLEGNPLGRSLVFSQARKGVLKKTKGFYPSPIIALDTVKKTLTMPLKKGLKKEIDEFVFHSDKGFANARHLIRVFFGMEHLKKQETQNPKKTNRVGVLGAGVMGSGIAWLASYRGNDVRMKDINWDALGSGYQEIQKIYHQLKKMRRVKPDAMNLMMHRVNYDIDYDGFRNQDLVIEAATENLDLKKKLFADLEERLSSDALIASNTSSLTIEKMSEGMKHPERFVGMHFFNPVNRMPLVEVVAGEKTSPEAVNRVVQTCLDWKKIPLVVKDCAGFLVNRIFAVQANEVMHILQEGIEMERLEHLSHKFGWPMGPFVLADTVGNDVSSKVFKEFEETYGVRFRVPKILTALADKQLNGKKSGKGFFIYEGKKETPNPEVKDLLHTIGLGSAKYSDQEIIDRMIAAMLNEACRCLEEGIVEKHSDVDMAMILGTGFPPFRGGLLAYANDYGIGKLVDVMKKLEPEHGERFAACESLKAMARDHAHFDV
ncbi:MAG: Fatty acid oxidation complex subunit alpha [Chlamydiae bacterium]|nr:Fatty acid oxidation complex subunit alpha [Chlamydiota bacterium]